MIIWKGWGILLLPIVALSLGATLFLWSEVLGLSDASPFIGNISLLLAFCLAGVISWYVGKALNKKKDDIFIHKQTGKEVKLSTKHSFFFIRMEYWGFVLPVIGFIAYFIASIQGSSMTF